MFAILETGSKQYKVEEGDILEVELLDKNKIAKDNSIDFDSVLLLKDDKLHIGQPFVKNAWISAKVLEEFKAPKVIVFKKKSKKQYKKTRGHRQNLHRIQIEKIQIGAKPVEKPAAKAEPEKETKVKPAAKAKAKAETVKETKPKAPVAEKPKTAAKDTKAKTAAKPKATPKPKADAAKEAKKPAAKPKAAAKPKTTVKAKTTAKAKAEPKPKTEKKVEKKEKE